MKKLICAAFIGALLSAASASFASEGWSALRHDLFAFEWRFNPADKPARVTRDLTNFRGLSLYGATGNLAFAAFGAVDDPQKSYSLKLAQVALAAGGAALAVYALDEGRDAPKRETATTRDLTPEEVAQLLADAPPEVQAALALAIGAQDPGGPPTDTRPSLCDREPGNFVCINPAIANYVAMLHANTGNLDSGAYNGAAVTAVTQGGRTTYTIRYAAPSVRQNDCDADWGGGACSEFEAHSAQLEMVSVRVSHCGDSSRPARQCGTQAERDAALVYLACELGSYSRLSCGATAQEIAAAEAALATRLGAVPNRGRRCQDGWTPGNCNLQEYRSPLDEYIELQGLFSAENLGRRPVASDYLRRESVMMERWKTGSATTNNGDVSLYNYASEGRGPLGDAITSIVWECNAGRCRRP
jgi:hypothetical protein